MSVSETAVMTGSPGLFVLPPELRNEVYRNVVVLGEIHIVEWKSEEDFQLALPGLLQTSQALRKEALPIYFGENKFVIEQSMLPVFTQYLLTHTSLAPLCCIRKTRLVLEHANWHSEAWHVDIEISRDRKVLSVHTTRAFASRAGKHVVRLFQQALCSPFVMSKEAHHFHGRILVKLARWLGNEPGGPTSLNFLLSGEGARRGQHQISFGLEEVQRTGQSAGILKAYNLVEVS
ncbi:hypothetical protein LTS18_011320 [Coniosporium uncinatum]|uniref:Uncharacterized protein n=1 Tax=Coniosporium uncinatum TaxID=93489 RepID=A0ACC3DWK8_9PEZI|nr:hypothetical protein LTS18_011320 [Coniosporium uncinatum]